LANGHDGHRISTTKDRAGGLMPKNRQKEPPSRMQTKGGPTSGPKPAKKGFGPAGASHTLTQK